MDNVKRNKCGVYVVRNEYNHQSETLSFDPLLTMLVDRSPSSCTLLPPVNNLGYKGNGQ
jgi:hypothetical protein